MGVKYFSSFLLVVSFLAATLGFGILTGVAGVVCRAIFIVAFVSFGLALGASPNPAPMQSDG